MPSPLDQLSMVCANFGNGPALRAVLADWYEFLGGKPNEVVIVDGGSDADTLSTCLSLFQERQIDKLHLLQPTHRENDKERCFIQEYEAAIAGKNPYLLFFKFDTLPFRVGHEDWLAEAMGKLDEPGVFAVSGALNRTYDWRPRDAEWYETRNATINFCLMKRSSFVASMESVAADYLRSGFTGTHRLERFLLERGFIEYQQQHGLHTLNRIEDARWTVFHTNVYGAELLKVRERFRRREGLDDYLNPCMTDDITRYAYYGQPITRADAITRARIALGASPAGQIWRQIKKGVTG